LTQHLDDILDGDRLGLSDPLSYVNQLVDQIKAGRYDRHQPIALLAQSLLADAAQFEMPDDDFQGDLLQLIDLLQTDFQRRISQQPLSATDLAEHHRWTFYYSLNLTLMVANADFRADRLPHLIDLFCWCSPVRDLAEDLGKGLINIPLEVINAAETQAEQKLHLTALLTAPVVVDWLTAEYHSALQTLAAASAEVTGLKGLVGYRVMQAALLALKHYVIRYGKQMHQQPIYSPNQSVRAVNRSSGQSD
jgi:hypothetical protein